MYTHVHKIWERDETITKQKKTKKKIVASLPRMCRINNILIVHILCVYNNWMSRKKNSYSFFYLRSSARTLSHSLSLSASRFMVYVYFKSHTYLYTDLTYSRLHNDLQRAARE